MTAFNTLANRLKALQFTGPYAEAQSAGRHACLAALHQLEQELSDAAFERIQAAIEDMDYLAAQERARIAAEDDAEQPNAEQIADSDRADWQAFRSAQQ